MQNGHRLLLMLNFLRKKKKTNKKPNSTDPSPNTNLSCLESDKVNRINSPYEKTLTPSITSAETSRESGFNRTHDINSLNV